MGLGLCLRLLPVAVVIINFGPFGGQMQRPRQNQQRFRARVDMKVDKVI